METVELVNGIKLRNASEFELLDIDEYDDYSYAEFLFYKGHFYFREIDDMGDPVDEVYRYPAYNYETKRWYAVDKPKDGAVLSAMFNKWYEYGDRHFSYEFIETMRDLECNGIHCEVAKKGYDTEYDCNEIDYIFVIDGEFWCVPALVDDDNEIVELKDGGFYQVEPMETTIVEWVRA